MNNFKKALALLLAILAVSSFAGCNTENKDSKDTDETTAAAQTEETTADEEETTAADEETSADKTEDIQISEIDKAIQEALGDGYIATVDVGAEDELALDYYGLDSGKIDEFIIKEAAISAVDPDKIVILKVKDGYADTAVEALNGIFANNVDYSKLYAFNTAKILNSRIFRNGNYVAYIVAGATYGGEDSEAEAQLAKDEYAKIDAVWTSFFGGEAENLAVLPNE